jgi:sugar diacid utilization regulator
VSDNAIPAEFVQRFEQLVRDNERLQAKVDELQMAVGHTVVLVKLAAAVRQWERDSSAESLEQIIARADDYYKDRGRGPGPSPWAPND